MKIVEDDLQRISRCVTQQSEALHEKLGKLRTDCSDESYPVDFLRGAQQRARVQLGWRCVLTRGALPPRLQSKRTR